MCYLEETNLKTLTGISIKNIPIAMNKKLSPYAYKEIPSGTMSGKTDVDFQDMRDRFDEVFGPYTVGWRFFPHPIYGKPPIVSESQQEGKSTWYTVRMESWVLEYAIVDNEGKIQWVQTAPHSDADKNIDLGYAYRGAETSWLKHIWRSFGGMNHILNGEYTHEHAKRDIANGKTSNAENQDSIDKGVVTAFFKKWKDEGLSTEDVLNALGIKKASEWKRGWGKEADDCVNQWLASTNADSKPAAPKNGNGAAPANPVPPTKDKPKNEWWKNPSEHDDAVNHVARWKLTIEEAIKKMGAKDLSDFSTRNNFFEQFHSKAIEGCWPMLVTKANYKEQGKGNVIGFDTPLGAMTFYSRKEFVGKMNTIGLATVDWSSMESWDIGYHELPEPIFITPKMVGGKLEIDTFEAVAAGEGLEAF